MRLRDGAVCLQEISRSRLESEMRKRSRALGVIVMFVIAASMMGAQPLASARQESQGSQPFPRIGAAVLQDLMTAAEGRRSESLLGLHDIRDGSRRLSILSIRVAIAGSAAKGMESGATYNPPESLLAGDAVFIECGDTAQAGGFAWANPRVTSPTVQPLAPVGYSAGPKKFQNAHGLEWTASKAAGTFRVSDLKHGFTVTYVGTDDVESIYEVSAAEAQHELLLMAGD